MRTNNPKVRNLDFMKPAGYKDYFTLAELSRKVERHETWLKDLETRKKIPLAKRVKFGNVMIRLWSPVQVKEIQRVIANSRPGRPRKS